MEWVSLKEKVPAFVKKYGYVALILGIGLLLMIIPSQDSEDKTEEVIPEQSHSILSVEDQLSQILSRVAGAGEVQVMLSVASGEEILYQTNDDFSNGSDNGTSRLDTVTVTDAQRNEVGLVRQVNPPVYMGAIVVCKGADSPSVRLAIVEAVANATGLGTDKISVLKMK